MDWNWTVVKWLLLVSLELSTFRRIQKQGWMREITKLGKGVKWFFSLHFASPSLAFVRQSPSSTPRTPNTWKVLLCKKKEQKTRHEKINALLLKAAITFIFPVPRQARRKMVSFFPWCYVQVVANFSPIDEFHFRKVVRDLPSPKNQSGKILKNHCQNMVSSWFSVHEPFSGLFCQWLERMSPCQQQMFITTVFAQILLNSLTNYCSHQGQKSSRLSNDHENFYSGMKEPK